MFKQWLIDNLYGIITTILGGTSIFAFISERNKRKIQEKKDESSAKKEEADALETIQTVYDKFVKDSLDRYVEMMTQIEAIKKELQDVYLQLENVTKELEIEKERSRLLNISYENLKKTCEEFNKKSDKN